MNDAMKKTVSMLIAILMTLSFSFGVAEDSVENEKIPVTVAFAVNRWDHYWKPGDKLVNNTDESQNRVKFVLEQINLASVGTLIREGQDNDTIERQYEDYLRILQDGADIQEQLFADIGIYVWAVGLPDEQSISQEEARRISCQVLMEEAGISEEQMAHFYPHFTYETGDPQNPFWHITWLPFDQGADVSRILDVAVYAHDGSVCGYKIAVPVG